MSEIDAKLGKKWQRRDHALTHLNTSNRLSRSDGLRAGVRGSAVLMTTLSKRVSNTKNADYETVEWPSTHPGLPRDKIFPPVRSRCIPPPLPPTVFSPSLLLPREGRGIDRRQFDLPTAYSNRPISRLNHF